MCILAQLKNISPYPHRASVSLRKSINAEHPIKCQQVPNREEPGGYRKPSVPQVSASEVWSPRLPACPQQKARAVGFSQQPFEFCLQRENQGTEK